LKFAKSFFTIYIFCFVFSVNASETDQYMTWGKEIKDSNKVINSYMNEDIRKALKKVNKKNLNYPVRR